jgi:hypothetical protein
MEKGPKIALAVTALMVLVIGGEFAWQYHLRHEEGPAPKTAEDRPVEQDFLVYRKKERPTTPKDEQDLIGKTVWVAAGGQMSYYPDKAKHADYAEPVGELAGAEPLLIHEVFEQKAPASAAVRIPAGQKQVLLGFTMPKSGDPKAMYALPVGDFDEGAYTFFSDDIFFYDDPHQLYNHWPASVWEHIDKHEAAPGMTEDQVAMALGQVATPSGDSVGNRSIQYDNAGHPVSVEFENGKATKVTPDSK